MENAFSAKKSGYGRSFVTLSMRSGVILLVGFVMVLGIVAGAAGCSACACDGVGGCSISALFSSSVDSFKYVEYVGII